MPRDVRKNKDFLYKNEKNIKNKYKNNKNVPGHFRSDLIGAGSVMREHDFRKSV